jgi:SAM-dependent methyltransferase
LQRRLADDVRIHLGQRLRPQVHWGMTDSIPPLSTPEPGIGRTGHAETAASLWVARWAHLVPAGGSVLDVACGSGRHVRWFAQRGHAVTGLDRDAAATQPLHAIARIVTADIEGQAWPLSGQTFDAVIVTRYLWRTLLPTLVASVGSGGVLIYETFANGQQSIGTPKNPDFLLQPGELLGAVQSLRVVAFEDVFEAEPERFMQRIVAVREAPAGGPPPRHLAAPAGPQMAGG